MKLPSHNSASCAIFGHNYFKIKNNASKSVIVCSCCGHTTNDDFFNELNDNYNLNLNILALIRYLFVLKRKAMSFSFTNN